MRKKLVLGITIVCVFLLAACQSTGRQNNFGKVLILYYSWSEQSNTENAAKVIQDLTNADMIKVEPVTPFPELNAEEFIAWGRKQLENQSLPEIKDLGVDPSSYDFIFIGTPVWFGTVSFPIEALLLKTDFGCKPVTCFAMANSNERDILAHFGSKVKNAQVREGIAFRMKTETEVQSKITQWVNGLL